MNTQLTLSIEQNIAQFAHEYATDKKQTLSELVENYFKLIATQRKQLKTEELHPRVQKLRGILTTEPEFDAKKVLTEELIKRNGR